MKFKIRPTSQFRKDLKLAVRRGCDPDLLAGAVKLLASGETLPERFRDHPLRGAYKGCRECHITPDWLLIYEIDGGELFLYLTRTGTHSDLF